MTIARTVEDLRGVALNPNERELLLSAGRPDEDVFAQPPRATPDPLEVDELPWDDRIATLKAMRRLEDLALVRDPATVTRRHRGRVDLTTLGREFVDAHRQQLSSGGPIG